MSPLLIEVEIGPGLFAALLVFARITALLHVAPMLGSLSVPVRIRIALAALVTLLITPSLPFDDSLATWDVLWMAWLILRELMVGAGMGAMIMMLLAIIDFAGTFVGINSGLGMAVQFDPMTNAQALVLTRLFQVAGFVAFFAADLHHQMFLGLVDSFLLMPPGEAMLATTAGLNLSAVIGQVFIDSARIAMPVIAAVLFLNLVSALVTRFAQQMNIYFSVGLPANAAAGLFAAGLAVPALIAAVLAQGSSMRELMVALLDPALR